LAFANEGALGSDAEAGRESMPQVADERTQVPVAQVVGILPLDRPGRWLKLGWRDFTRAPQIGLLYGFGLVAASVALSLLLATANEIHLLLPCMGGFLILAPLLVAGLYNTSRSLEAGKTPKFTDALMLWRAPGQLLLMGACLLLIHIAWLAVTLQLYPLFFHDRAHSAETYLPELLGTSAGLALLATGTVTGALFALAAFAICAVSIPMLVDREVSLVQAIRASLTVVRTHTGTMLLWAALIALLTGLGIATLFLGLALVVPVIAHASWHAYRDTLGRDGHGDEAF
jgi:uncharacterized membrane protein